MRFELGVAAGKATDHYPAKKLWIQGSLTGFK